MFQFGRGGSSTNHVQPTYFDIRVQSRYKNVIMVKGAAHEASPFLVSGHVVTSIPEDIQVKKITLNLVGTYKLDFLESYKDTKSSSMNAIKAESTIVKVVWENLLNSKEGVTVKGNYGDEINDIDTNLNRVNVALNDLLYSTPTSSSGLSLENSNSASSASLSGKFKSSSSSKISSSINVPTVLQFDNSIPTGQTPFPDTAINTNCVYKLPKGNYSLPFEVLLPGNIPETVEGLQYGAILYRFESRIETVKSSTKHPLVAYKYLRIFRQPAPFDIVLNQDCSIENNWPNKIQYEVRIPRKAVPIGAKTKVHILIVPLQKNMKLGKISATIHQFFYLRGPKNERFEDEKVIYKCELPEVSMDDLDRDRWSLEAKIFIPNKLKQCSQDCTIRDDLIKIRHKLVLSINLINPDGHTSQVKSKLPIMFYISPNENVIGRNAYVDVNGRVRFKVGHKEIFRTGTEAETPPPEEEGNSSTPGSSDPTNRGVRHNHNHHHHNHHHNHSRSPGQEEIHVDRNYEIGNPLDPEEDDEEDGEEEEFLPSYRDSGRDVLFTPDMLSPSGYISPAIRSGTQTPSYFDIEPRRPQVPGGGATGTGNGSDGGGNHIANETQEGYFSTPGLASGMASPAFQFLSRVNSSSNLTSQIDAAKLSEVPSYMNVYDLDYEDQDEPAPLYNEADVTTPSEYYHLKSSRPGTLNVEALHSHLDSHGQDRALADYLVSRILDTQNSRFTSNGDSNTNAQAADVGVAESTNSASGDEIRPIPISQQQSPMTSSSGNSNDGVGAFGMSQSPNKSKSAFSLGRAQSSSSFRNIPFFGGSSSGSRPKTSRTKSTGNSVFRLSSSLSSSRNNSSVNLHSAGNAPSLSAIAPGSASNPSPSRFALSTVGMEGRNDSDPSNELGSLTPPPTAHSHAKSPTSTSSLK